MTNQKFIETIAPIVQAMVKKYGYGVPSAIIAQACLESAYGTSTKAQRHNYFGLKYRPNRVSCNSGTFVDGSKEQNSDGSYVSITDQWFAFASMEKGVEGYFQFISIPNYDGARAVSSPKEYLQALKSAGYATSKSYVENNLAVISKWGLTKYDVTIQIVTGKNVSIKEVTKVTKPKITKLLTKSNFGGRGINKISYIVMHYTGNKTDTAKANANYFKNVSGVSAHYIVDETSIYQSVEDDKAAWHCGVNYGANNLFGKCKNQNSIGIEMCSTNGAIAAKTIDNAVALVKYLMAKYNIPVERVVRHWDVCSKQCPGWVGWNPKTGSEAKWTAFKKRIADGSVTTAVQTTTTTTDSSFKVQVLVDDLNIRTGPGVTNKVVGVTGKGIFTIVETNSAKTWGKLKSGAGWIYLGSNKYTKKV